MQRLCDSLRGYCQYDRRVEGFGLSERKLGHAKNQLRPFESHASNAAHENGSELSHHLTALNREMMQLSMEKRRERWMEYYKRLGELIKPMHNVR